MFSNYPENVDDALRQRAGARWLMDGPQTRDDYIDIFVLLAGKNHNIPLGDHDLFGAQVIEKAISVAYEEHSKPKELCLELSEDKTKVIARLPGEVDLGGELNQNELNEPFRYNRRRRNS